ncbi:MAG: HD domain-containing protein, partial [Rhodobacteraceae bacterium]|nr:HD domain-containing protein [Paracoccaceae bacterium]
MGNKVAKDTNPLRLALTSQGLIRALGKTPCKGPYHPEEHRLQHTRIVWIRYALSSGFAMAKHSLTQEDLRTLETAVWCHDIGCIHCTQYNETKKSYTAYGHEKVSYEMMESLKEPIEEYG